VSGVRGFVPSSGAEGRPGAVSRAQGDGAECKVRCRQRHSRRSTHIGIRDLVVLCRQEVIEESIVGAAVDPVAPPLPPDIPEPELLQHTT